MARDMQRAWIAYRDTTCNFYDDKIHGSMAIPMGRPVRPVRRRVGPCSSSFSAACDGQLASMR